MRRGFAACAADGGSRQGNASKQKSESLGSDSIGIILARVKRNAPADAQRRATLNHPYYTLTAAGEDECARRKSSLAMRFCSAVIQP
jgi:hypothetical protein